MLRRGRDPADKGRLRSEGRRADAGRENWVRPMFPHPTYLVGLNNARRDSYGHFFLTPTFPAPGQAPVGWDGGGCETSATGNGGSIGGCLPGSGAKSRYFFPEACAFRYPHPDSDLSSAHEARRADARVARELDTRC